MTYFNFYGNIIINEVIIMTSKERMLNFFNRKKSDKLPQVEWATWWNLTLDRWYNTEGLDPTITGKKLMEHFGHDYMSQTWVWNGLGAHCPRVKASGFINDADDYEKLRPLIYDDFDYDRYKRHFTQVHEEFELAGDISWFTFDGFFWFPRNLFGIEDHFYSFYDYPDLYHRICEDRTEHILKMLDILFDCCEPQFMTWGEDMSYNHGPMLSHEIFNEFIKPYYDRINPVIQKHNIKVIVDSDGDITEMVPWLINSGCDGILPLERQAGVDVNKLTEAFPDFFFIGGYDKMVMKYGEEAQAAEFERIQPSLKRGNFLPGVDHQTPPDVSLENYYTFCKLLEKACIGAMK